MGGNLYFIAMEEAMKLSVKVLKGALAHRGVDYSDCIEKSDLARKYVETTPKEGTVFNTQKIVGGLECNELTMVGSPGSPKLGVVILHGYGANRHDLFPIIHQLLKTWSSPTKPSIYALVPDGPITLSQTSKAWFPLDFMKLISTPPTELAKGSLPGLDDASDKVIELINEMVNQSCEKIILSGFSQGAILSAHSTFRLPDTKSIAALGLFSCAVQAREKWTEAAKELKNVKVLLSHGTSDPVIPYTMGEMMRSILQDAPGVELDFVSFQGGHTIPPNVIAKFRNLIESVATSLAEK